MEINKERFNKLSREVKELREIVHNLNDPYIIEKLAREKLFMVRPGEIPIFIIEEESKPSFQSNFFNFIKNLFSKK